MGEWRIGSSEWSGICFPIRYSPFAIRSRRRAAMKPPSEADSEAATASATPWSHGFSFASVARTRLSSAFFPSEILVHDLDPTL
jgi:hypothetical protein